MILTPAIYSLAGLPLAMRLKSQRSIRFKVRLKTRRVVAQNRHLVLGTISFTVCFAAWGLVGAFAPRFREVYSLNASETAFLVAVSVLLGSLARVPMGLLTDRVGGRVIFPVLMTAVAL